MKVFIDLGEAAEREHQRLKALGSAVWDEVQTAKPAKIVVEHKTYFHGYNYDVLDTLGAKLLAAALEYRERAPS